MKSCPTCNRTFEDTFTFCLIDGSVLSAPFDPQGTRHQPDERGAAPPRTEVIPRRKLSEDNAIPPTMPSPPLSTIQTAPPSVPSVDWSNEKPSKVSAEELERLVKVWENKVGRRSNTTRLVALRLVAFVLLLLTLFLGLRVLIALFSGRILMEFVLWNALFAVLFGWAARRCWRLASDS